MGNTKGRLSGKRALITAAGRGIGRAGALSFAREGAKVLCSDVEADLVDELVAEIEAAGGIAVGARCDVTDPSQIEAIVGLATDTFGGLDIAWANAGGSCAGAALDLSREQWDNCLTLNLTSAWLTTKFALPALIESGHGSLIYTASMAGQRGLMGTAAYAAAKSGVIGFARQVAIEYATHNVRANVVLPASTQTKMLMASYEERAKSEGSNAQALLDATVSGYPLRRVGQPEDMASLALFLASDESGWMTGHALAVDGGRFARF